MAALTQAEIDDMIASLREDFSKAETTKEKIAISNAIINLQDQSDKMAQRDPADDDEVAKDQKRRVEGGLDDLMDKLSKFTPIKCQGYSQSIEGAGE